VWLTSGQAVVVRSTKDPVVSHEHHGARWIDPVELRAGLTDDMINALADGNTRVGDLVCHIRPDLDRYLRRIGRYPAEPHQAGLGRTCRPRHP